MSERSNTIPQIKWRRRNCDSIFWQKRSSTQYNANGSIKIAMILINRSLNESIVKGEVKCIKDITTSKTTLQSDIRNTKNVSLYMSPIILLLQSSFKIFWTHILVNTDIFLCSLHLISHKMSWTDNSKKQRIFQIIKHT